MGNKPQTEFYYQTLIENGYEFLDYSEKHYVFRKDNRIIKVAKKIYNTLDNDESFEIEKLAHELMIRFGLPVAKITRIYQKGELLYDYTILEEEYCEGDVFYNKDLSTDLLRQIYGFLETSSKIGNDKFGFLSNDKCKMYNSWKEFIISIIANAKTDKSVLIDGLNVVPNEVEAKLILTDVNTANFIFIDGKINKVIDIERPLFGDKQFLYAVIKSRNLKLFGLIDNNKINHQLVDYYQIVYKHLFDWINI